jgi:hypothetical protein
MSDPWKVASDYRIDYKLLLKASTALERISTKEEATLTDEECARINKYLRTIADVMNPLRSLLYEAKNRYRNKGK